MQDLSNKNVVVTGAASGIGASMVNIASLRGAAVFCLDIDEDSGAAIAEQHGANFYPCDVSKQESWQQVAQHLNATLDGIDHLHLNAGIQSAPPSAPLEEYSFAAMTLERYRKMIGVNIDGVVLGLMNLLPMMKDGGSIVVTGSMAGIVPYDVDPLYSMTKHAVTGLVRSLKKELLIRDIRINAICPSGVDTAIIPNAQRGSEMVFMRPDAIAEEVISLFLTQESGETFAKVSESKPAWVVKGPGRKR
ncbi:MAG: NAD(P)-dependent dehydrogenase (short-subunit alcohol dehydrogenase family) [Candidatus Azotimanducaceae bacterium]|jgi:NAD(P)-dependent dehydrogenase (short-subunit alcohol dehydrogenase family)